MNVTITSKADIPRTTRLIEIKEMELKKRIDLLEKYYSFNKSSSSVRQLINETNVRIKNILLFLITSRLMISNYLKNDCWWKWSDSIRSEFHYKKALGCFQAAFGIKHSQVVIDLRNGRMQEADACVSILSENQEMSEFALDMLNQTMWPEKHEIIINIIALEHCMQIGYCNSSLSKDIRSNLMSLLSKTCIDDENISLEASRIIELSMKTA